MEGTIEVTMALEHETKGAIRFKEWADGKFLENIQDGTVGQLYIRKDKMGKKPYGYKVTLTPIMEPIS